MIGGLYEYVTIIQSCRLTTQQLYHCVAMQNISSQTVILTVGETTCFVHIYVLLVCRHMFVGYQHYVDIYVYNKTTRAYQTCKKCACVFYVILHQKASNSAKYLMDITVVHEVISSQTLHPATSQIDTDKTNRCSHCH